MTRENIGTAWRLQQTTSLCVKQFPAVRETIPCIIFPKTLDNRLPR